MLTKLCSLGKFHEKTGRALCSKMTKKPLFFHQNTGIFEKWTYQKCPFLLFPFTFVLKLQFLVMPILRKYIKYL